MPRQRTHWRSGGTTVGHVRRSVGQVRPLRVTSLLLAAITLAMAGAGCASGHGLARGRSATERGVDGHAALAEARRFSGAAYQSGGSTPAGFDCSGFVQYVYGQLGVVLPRTVREQYATGRRVSRDSLQPGDLVFFQTERHGVSHVGLATGDGAFIHAPNARSRVRTDRLDARYWDDRFVGARRMKE